MTKYLKTFGLLLLIITATACTKVPAGHVGVKVYLLGSSKGVDHEVVGPGRYWLWLNEEMFLFPTFKQTDTWKDNQAITFQTQEGLSVNCAVGVTYSIAPQNVAKVFASYRRGVSEISDIFLHNMVRDAFNNLASTMPIEAVYGNGKEKLIKAVQERVIAEVKPLGIDVENLYLVGTLNLSSNVTAAINAKIEATQRAIMRENELREAEAQSKKTVAEAEGEARARLVNARSTADSALLAAKAEAEGQLIKAEARAKGNRALAASATPAFIEYQRIMQWNGELPRVTTGSGGMMLFNSDVSTK